VFVEFSLRPAPGCLSQAQSGPIGCPSLFASAAPAPSSNTRTYPIFSPSKALSSTPFGLNASRCRERQLAPLAPSYLSGLRAMSRVHFPGRDSPGPRCAVCPRLRFGLVDHASPSPVSQILTTGAAAYPGLPPGRPDQDIRIPLVFSPVFTFFF